MKYICLALACALAGALLSACARDREGVYASPQEYAGEADPQTRDYLVVVEEEPDTVDFQCTTLHYTVALNAFNRLVETRPGADGGADIVPSLAESWEVSGDGRTYTFHLREGVRFSNGSPLTASDVLYTMKRLLTHPDSCNGDIAREIAGAAGLERGEAESLEGFELLNDRDFAITLAQPFSAFLACLSMPGASILDAETTEAAGDRFGQDPEWTVGTGPFVMERWERGKDMLLAANPDCWEGRPGSAGLDLRFITDGEAERAMFNEGELDILELDNLGDSAEYFIHGDIYQDRLHREQETGISYIALNQSVEPLGDVRVRRALQLSLDRQTLLDAVYSGRGTLENGILPQGLKGYNPDLEAIAFDPEAAAALLAEAGYSEGFDLKVSVRSSSTQWEKELMSLAATMWGRVGVRATVEVVDEEDFFRRRKTGELACYTATWSADFDDPDNFFYTFFGSRENALFRSLCYGNEAVMARVRAARAIVDEAERLREYRALERIIVGEDAAWIPLFSRQRCYVVSERVARFQSAWNGWVSPCYRYIVLDETQG